jgi:hypothetical protein
VVGEVATLDQPLIVLFDQEHAGEANQRPVVGVDPDDVGAARRAAGFSQLILPRDEDRGADPLARAVLPRTLASAGVVGAVGLRLASGSVDRDAGQTLLGRQSERRNVRSPDRVNPAAETLAALARRQAGSERLPAPCATRETASATRQRARGPFWRG